MTPRELSQHDALWNETLSLYGDDDDMDVDNSALNSGQPGRAGDNVTLRCQGCGQRVTLSNRDLDGKRHVCGDQGTPLGGSLSKGTPLAQRQHRGEIEPLRKGGLHGTL